MKIQDSISSAQPLMSRRLFLNVGTAAAAAATLSACSGGGDDKTNAATDTTPPTTPPVSSVETCIPGNNTFAVEAGTSKTISFGEIYVDDRGSCYIDGIGDPQNGKIVNTATSVTYTPNAGFTGTDTFVVRYTDGRTSTITVTVTAPNAPDTTPPTITLNGANPMTLTVGTAYAEPGANWTDNKDGSGVVTTISGTVGATVGSYTITYTRSDAAGNIGTATRTVNIVAAADPAPIAGGAFAALADMTVSDQAGAFTITINAGGVTDTLGRAIAYSTTGLPTGLSINSSTGIISGTYDATSNEVFTVSITAQATGSSQSLSKTFILTIRNDG